MIEMRRIDISTANLDRLGIQYDPSRFRGLSSPLIMGIVNVTPDSFSDGGRFDTAEKAVEHAIDLVREGADIVDIGGESTRPFADPVTLDQEISRVLPVVERLSEKIPVPISIDTRHAEVAGKALNAGAAMVNDVNAFQEDGMEELLVETGAGSVIMHMKGKPKDMQVSPSYEDVIEEIHDFLEMRISTLVKRGYDSGKIFIDPGIGFGKRVEDNLRILKNLHLFEDLGCPLLVGASRKSFMGKVLDLEVDQRLEGSIASAVIAFMNGASVLRVHDVKETRKALDLTRAILDS